MTRIIKLDEIKNILPEIDLVKIIEDGFIEYSKGNVFVPPVVDMIFDNPPGETHVKCGHIKSDNYFVIKIASGFYNNPAVGLSTSQGVMLVFSKETGELKSILLDGGYLTDIRTAAAGAAVARNMVPKKVNCIGIIGTGIQGRMQLEFLKSETDCRDVLIYGIDSNSIHEYLRYFQNSEFNIRSVNYPKELTAVCNLIVTTTPAKKPILKNEYIQKGTHITAMGSDTPEKNELDPEILANADIVVADSLSQSELRGEIFKAVSAGKMNRSKVAELGNIFSGDIPGRENEEQITVADLTGVAVQDIQIAKTVYEKIKLKETK